MRIVAWNCSRGPLTKKLSALDALAPDLAVLSEAPPPTCESEQNLWFPSEVSSLGVQVRATGQLQLARLPSADLPNCVSPVRVLGPHPFNLLAVWTWPAPSYVKAFNNALDAYQSLIESGPTVIAGDFNGNPIYDKPRQWVKWGDAFARLNELGLVSAYHYANEVAYGCERDPTHLFLRKPDRPFHIDYCFIPKEWATNQLVAKVACGQEWSSIGDHFPVIVEVAIG